MTVMTSDEQAIRNLIGVWMDATQNGDTARVLELMTEDVVFLRPDQRAMQGRHEYEVLANSMDGKVPMEFEHKILEIRTFGDWAYCWSHLAITVIPASGERGHRRGDILSVFHRENDRWMLHRDANLVTPAGY